MNTYSLILFYSALSKKHQFSKQLQYRSKNPLCFPKPTYSKLYRNTRFLNCNPLYKIQSTPSHYMIHAVDTLRILSSSRIIINTSLVLAQITTKVSFDMNYIRLSCLTQIFNKPTFIKMTEMKYRSTV